MEVMYQIIEPQSTRKVGVEEDLCHRSGRTTREALYPHKLYLKHARATRVWAFAAACDTSIVLMNSTVPFRGLSGHAELVG